jgi:predicted alpha/beta hydrolase family esterase
MPEPEAPTYARWREKLARELSEVRGETILVGHSLGGSVILKYLAEDAPELLVAGVFLVAAPCWGAGEDWSAEEYLVSERSAAELSQRSPIFLYHSREDPIVPFSHLEAYAARLPEATIRVLDGSDHAFANGVSELLDVIVRHR